MNKKSYYIVPRNNIAMELNAENTNDAMSLFALKMDSDMNAYFKAMTKEEYEEAKLNKTVEDTKANITEFMINELTSQFDLEQNIAEDIAENAYEKYVSSKENMTQYDCIEKAYAEWLNSTEN